MKPLLFLQWIVTLIICFWAGALVFSVSLNWPAPCLAHGNYCPEQHANNNQGPSQRVNSPTGTSASHQNDSSTPAAQQADGNSAEWGMFWITFGLLIVAGWQAWYFRKQLRVMADTLTATKEAVRETKLSDERQLRAYLSIRFTLLGEIDEGKTVEFKFVCQNHGATPAKDIEFRANRWRFNGDIPKNFKPEPIAGDWNDKRANVFPHASREDAEKMDFSCDLGIPALTKEEADAFLGRKNAWLIGLEIRYWDVFSDAPKYTREYYRVVINAKNGVNVSILPGASFVS